MKKKRLTLIFTIALVAVLSFSCMTSYAGEWKRDNVGWWWQEDDKSYPTSQWQLIDGEFYYFNEAGYLLTNTTTPDGYEVDENGAWTQNTPAHKALKEHLLLTYQSYWLQGYEQDPSIWEWVEKDSFEYKDFNNDGYKELIFNNWPEEDRIWTYVNGNMVELEFPANEIGASFYLTNKKYGTLLNYSVNLGIGERIAQRPGEIYDPYHAYKYYERYDLYYFLNGRNQFELLVGYKEVEGANGSTYYTIDEHGNTLGETTLDAVWEKLYTDEEIKEKKARRKNN